MRRQLRRLRLDQRLAEVEREAGAEQHQRDAGGDVVDARQRAEHAVQQRQRGAGRRGDEHADPRRAAQVRAAEAGHRRQHQHAFEAEVDAARLLGQAFAQAHEQERHADAQRAADDRGEKGQQDVASCGGALGRRLDVSCASGIARLRRAAGTSPAAFQSTPRSASLARISTKAMPCSTCTEASGRPSRRCSRLPAAPKPPNRIATGMIANGFMARDERDQDAGIAVAGDQRGVRVGVHRRDLDRAGEARAAAAERAGEQDQAVRRQPDELRRAQVAADDAHREAARREREPEAERKARDDAEHEPPMHVGAGDAADLDRLGERSRRRLVERRRIAQRPFDELLEDARSRCRPGAGCEIVSLTPRYWRSAPAIAIQAPPTTMPAMHDHRAADHVARQRHQRTAMPQRRGRRAPPRLRRR